MIRLIIYNAVGVGRKDIVLYYRAKDKYYNYGSLSHLNFYFDFYRGFAGDNNKLKVYDREPLQNF